MFSITKTATGEYHEESGGSGYDFGCDGKDYATIPNHTISCTQRTTYVMDTTAKENGQEGGIAHWELSADGKTLTIRSTPAQAKASEKPTEVSYVRTSGSAGFVGAWRNTMP